MSLRAFIQSLPKAELHLHIEGTLEPALLFQLARKNGIQLPYADEAELTAAYQFDDLQSFLDLYYQGAGVLQDESDFYALTFAYLQKAASEGVQHAEIFFDPQTHTHRGIPFDTVIQGIYAALQAAEQAFDMTTGLILSFLRDLSEADALKTFEQALPHLDKLIAVGLDSAEVGHPPEKFKTVFAKARAAGLHTVAHAGEEGPADYIWSALQQCHVSRIDHGVRAIEDDRLVAYLVEHQIPLDMTPLSNIQLKVYPNMAAHPIKQLLDRGVCINISSDDPAYFGGYINDNYEAVANTFDLSKSDLIQLAANSIQASFASPERKQFLLDQLMIG